MSNNLNPDKALVFRIIHQDNLRWILEHGLYSRNSPCFDPNYTNIGNVDLIGKRQTRVVTIEPGGHLSDYVPFYFTPFSIMMLNIITGMGVPKRAKHEIVILVSSLPKFQECGVRFVFTNQHAYPITAKYYNDVGDLDKIDWCLLQSRDFKHDPDDPSKKERYQAEALAYKHVPVEALLGIGCFDDATATRIKTSLAASVKDLRVLVQPQWYF